MGGRLKLGQILITKGLISPEQLASALGEQERWGTRLGMTLVRMGFLDEETIVRTLAGQLRLPVARIRGKTVNRDVLALVSMEIAEKYRCLPLFLREEGGSRELLLAMEDPSDPDALDEISFRVGQTVRPVLVAPSELEDALQRHYHGAALMPEPAADLPPMSAPAPAEPDAEADTQPEPGLPPMDPLLDPNLEGSAPPVDEAPAPDSGARLDPAPLEAATDDAFDAFPEEPFGGFEAEPFSADRDPDPLEASFEGNGRAAPEPRRPAASSLEPQVLLQALAQLLVEKGVISRDEFAERLRRLAARPGEGA